MESIGFIMVSMSPFQEKILICVGLLKDAFISASDFPKSYFIFRQRSDCFMERFSSASISTWSSSKKGAVGFLLGVFWLKNSACSLGMCCCTASSAYCCILESMVVYTFSPSLFKLYLVPSGFGLFLIQSFIKALKYSRK